MKLEDVEILSRKGDMSDAAISLRLRAARIAAGFPTAKAFAAALGISYQTYYSQEKKGHPSVKTVGYLSKNHGIDFNFVFEGDLLGLQGHVRVGLETALAERKPTKG